MPAPKKPAEETVVNLPLTAEEATVARTLHELKDGLNIVKSETGKFVESTEKKVQEAIRAFNSLNAIVGDMNAKNAEDKHVADVVVENLRTEVENLSTLVFEQRDKVREAPSTSAAPAVYTKIAQVMQIVDAIGKDNQANHTGGRYNFRGVDQAMDAVGHALRQVGLIFNTSVANTEYETREVTGTDSQGRVKVTIWTTARITMNYIFIDPADGSSMGGSMVGEGRDMGDKATSKAEAMALKYFLFQALMIPVEGVTGQDSERENPQIQTTQPRAVPSRPAQPAAPQQSLAITDPEAQMNMAMKALQAARTPGSNLAAIRSYADSLDLLMVPVDGLRLGEHLEELRRMSPEPEATP